MIGAFIGAAASSANVPAQIRLDGLTHDILIATEIITPVSKTESGTIVSTVFCVWDEVLRRVISDPNLLYEYSKDPRKFEELIAACYERNGFQVTLTPRSGDLGRDVIAEKSGFGAVRILDQCKAFKKGSVVRPNDVRAIMGVLAQDRNASKAVITTTATFAPSIPIEWKDHIPYRLELRDGSDLVRWLDDLRST